MIRVRKLNEEPGETEREEGSQGVNSVDVVLKRVDLKAFSSRILRINPGGHTAFHSHAREHIAVVLTGRCKIETMDSVQELRNAMIVTVPSGEGHRFVNSGSAPLAILILNLFTEEEQKPVELLPSAKVEGEPKPEGA
jgi:quercetin dioxygenase-like cupin family protein